MCKKVLAYKVNMCEYMGVMENKQKTGNEMNKENKKSSELNEICEINKKSFLKVNSYMKLEI